MVKIYLKPWTSILATVLYILLSVHATAQIPDEITASLQQREQRFTNKMFAWKMQSDVTEMHHSKPTKAILLHARGQEYKPLVTNEDVQGHFSNVWNFTCNNTQTLVEGEIVTPKPYEAALRYVHMYSGNVGMSANVYMRPKNIPEWHPWTPEVWDCSGEAIRYRSPCQNNLDLWPEDFALLIGKNPLRIYGAKWRLISKSASNWIVAATVTKGNWSPYQIRMTLDCAHDNLPSIIEISAQGLHAIYTTRRFIRYEQDWIPAVVDCAFDMPRIIQRRRLWTLKDIKTSSQTTFTIPHPKIPIMDYRLLGTDLSTNDLIHAAERKDPYIVTYRWKGHTPDKQELEVLAKSPTFDPQPTRRDWLLWLPAILLVASGRLWIWKAKRGQRVNANAH